MIICKSFAPCIAENSRVLILGSMPGIKSLEAQQYYAHPQNRFWKLIGRCFNCDDLNDFAYSEKLRFLKNHQLALWDVIKSCDRIGSLDSNIKDEEPNDISGLLKKYYIERICLNGNKSYMAFKKYFPELLEQYPCCKLPSTSPANAKYRLQDLYNEWSAYIQ